MEKRKIILDCDPGHDDAIAIMLACSSKNIDLLCITVEAGNQTLEKTGKNALNLVQYFGINIPVCLGESTPIKRCPQICDKIHGETGLDGFEFPPLKINFSSFDAISMSRKLLLDNKDVTIVTTGALTNVGKLLLNYPEVKSSIKEIVIMGGSIGYGNVSPAAEFNILCDPEAADIVFKSGLDIKMMGLDVTRKVLVLPSIISRISKINNKASNLFVSLMKVFNENQKKVFGLKGGPLHDPVTIVYLLDPNVVTLKKMNVEIDISGGCSYGRTNCDQFDYLKKPHNAFVAVDIDVNKYWDIIEERIRNF